MVKWRAMPKRTLPVRGNIFPSLLHTRKNKGKTKTWIGIKVGSSHGPYVLDMF
jgi:hypothetical protein